MIEAGVTDFIEVGCGKTLMNLIGKISKDVRVYSVEDYESLIKTAEELKNNAKRNGLVIDKNVISEMEGKYYYRVVERCREL